MPAESGHILIVDDDSLNRKLLARSVQKEGHTSAMAENGPSALEQLRANAFDIVLLDLVMPEMDGFEVLEEIKRDPLLRHLPVIVISAQEGLEGVVRCIEMGAMDYLPKPFDPVLLRARLNACLAQKRLHDLEQAHLKAVEEYAQRLQAEQEKSERLLLNVLPGPIAQRLKQTPGIIADHFAEVTVLFADIVNFTEWSARTTPGEVVSTLNQVFSDFDRLAEQHGLEKIKTIGDAYMVAGGLPLPRADHAEAVADMALDILALLAEADSSLQVRIGIHTGPVVAGVIGARKFIYDVWGDTVNTASRMESHCPPASIQVTDATYQRLRHTYRFEPRGAVPIKGKGHMETYLLGGRR